MKPTIGSSMFGRRLVILALGAALAVMLGIAATREAAPATVMNGQSATDVQVLGAQPWTATPIEVQSGDSISIHATGLIRISPMKPGEQWLEGTQDPDGDPNCVGDQNFVAPGLTCYILIARVDNSKIVAVGSDRSFNISGLLGTGRLYLGVNDDSFADNTAAWNADIRTY
jgi:hypothetical protein